MSILKRLAIVASAALVASSSQVTSQPAATLPLVGYIANLTAEAQVVQIAAFRRGMEELGYVEGQNIRYEFRFANAVDDLRGPVAAEMVALEPAVIITNTGMGVFAAAATSTIPIVVANMSQTRLAEVRALPNNNITGTTQLPGFPGIAERLALAMELVPVAAKVGFLYDPSAATGAATRAAADAAASALGITVVFGEVQSADTIGAGAQALVDQGVNVIVFGPSSNVMSLGRNQMLEWTRTARIPVIYSSLPLLLAGGLVVLGDNPDLPFHAAAALVDRILKGANPGAIPIMEVDVAWFGVNLVAAAEIGFTFPPAVAARANQVIN